MKLVVGGQSHAPPSSFLNTAYTDLDSIASAIAYAWFATVVKKTDTVPLIQTPRPDLRLRAENLLALSQSGFPDVTSDPEKLDVLCIDDLYHDDLYPGGLRKPPPFPSHKFSLVDHNRLGSRFTEDNPNATVVSVVDHHEDEQLYKDTADPRIITVPTGSCTSLVAHLIESSKVAIIPELATLLICGIVIDTNGLKGGQKAASKDKKKPKATPQDEQGSKTTSQEKQVSKTTPRDTDAMTYLFPRSTVASASSPSIVDDEDPHDIPVLQNLTKDLKTTKEDVSHLGTRDLLRRDYKEVTLTPSWAKDSPIQVGLASVPVGFESWISRDENFYHAIGEWVKERRTAALIILASFDDEKKSKKKEDKEAKGKHKRQLLAIVADNEDLASKLFLGLEDSKKLDLEDRSFKKFGAKKAAGDFGGDFQAKVYNQGNVDANRKIVAPVVKEIVEGSPNVNQ
jgi:exopolyphosphatase